MTDPGAIRILAISGSLRARSTNTELLRACVSRAPPGVQVDLYEGLDRLPHFNADLDTEHPPAAVAAWRARIAAADALLVSSPEYAGGVPGTLKNALDWLVGSSDVVEKPVALLNGSPRSIDAQAALLLILRTISARPISDAPYLAPVLGRNLDCREILQDSALAAVCCSVLRDLVKRVRDLRRET